MEREYMEKINNYCQKKGLTLDYADVDRTGPSHCPEFTVMVKINGENYGTGTGKNKKEAKAIAAKVTWEIIERQPESPSDMQAAKSTSPVTISPVQTNDFVSLLNIYSQKTSQIVDYRNIDRTGDAHAPMFSYSCTISGFVYGIGAGTSVAAAKQAAAKQAFEKLQKEDTLTFRSEKSDRNSTFSKHSNSSRVATQSESDSICFEDSAPKLVVKKEVHEKPSPSQRNPNAVKPKRKLAANFDSAKNNEEAKRMSDSNESLEDLDTNTSKNQSPYTVNKRFLEDFKNIEPVGEGGFGNVFKATSKLDEKTYAVKRVRFTKDVRREVKELARLDHENVVRYHSCWKGYDRVTLPDSGYDTVTWADSRQKSDKEIPCLFIQMDFCEKGPLENWITKHRQDKEYHKMAKTKFLQILKGVNYIHSEGLIHRDLKPQNIFISHEDKIKIGDFGLVTSQASETLTENRGTKSYMAPEQFGDTYGKEVDIYALGLIGFEILSGISCHEKSKVWPNIKEGKLPERFINEFPTEASIIKKMLSGHPKGRYSSTHDAITFLMLSNIELVIFEMFDFFFFFLNVFVYFSSTFLLGTVYSSNCHYLKIKGPLKCTYYILKKKKPTKHHTTTWSVTI
ncbi:interferon-induced, double-stranded RNA-activated protein kinase isoform X1 [Patagioenas fasciata]|uniref:interferon-induced, double-stranded RNA-activated protein kinase isoform X1 n=1 Tax=Patagioenas fasciata TaxID=372321 RepID=UPI003A99D805